MESVITEWILPNWQRKIVALFAALIIWVFVSQSITETKTIPGVAIKLVNLPVDKIVVGQLPNGLLNKRITLTLSGTKDIIENLESSDLEVVLDASNAPNDWVVQILKKDLVSLNPSVDLHKHISQVQHQEFVIEFSQLTTAKIPITIPPPTGQPPDGYQFLDIWPKRLMQTVSGPAEQIKHLRSSGLELSFDLRDIRKEMLDSATSAEQEFYKDEVSFKVPENWKRVVIPFLEGTLQQINDPEAESLRIDFLRMEYIPLEHQIPVQVFYPLNQSKTINPTTHKLAENAYVSQQQGLYVLALPVVAYHVSRLFLDIVRNYLQLTIIASPTDDKDTLPWSVKLMRSQELEDQYVDFLSNRHGITNKKSNTYQRLEQLWRNRFRDYMQEFRLYKTDHTKLLLKNRIIDNQIVVEE